MATSKTVIIGGGQAGAQAAMSLRQGGYDGAITMICDEPLLPYQRPPLSKAYLKGELDKERLFFKPADYYTDQNIDILVGERATRIDRASKKVECEGGQSLDYDHVIISTGSRVRELPVPGADLDGICYLRGIADVDQLRPRMEPGKRLIIVGAGYIGLEVAAVARQLGLEVTVLEAAPRVLARVTSPTMSAFYTETHKAEGVNIITDARLESFEGTGGSVSGVKMADGEILPCDVVLIGIGILPNQEIAEEAGIACKDGIIVDLDARTNDPAIYALGDCARRPLVHYGREGRLESVHNAIEQGKIAATHILGKLRPPEDTPWFWSDQYKFKLQIAGLSQGADETITRGDPSSGSFAVFYLKNGTVISVDAVNAAPEFIVGKKLIALGAKLAPELLADTSVNMKEIAAKAAG